METKPSHRHPLRRRVRVARLCAALALAGASACAHAGLFDDSEARARIEAVKQQVDDLSKQVSDQIKTLQQQLSTMDTANKNQVLDLLSKIQAQQDLIARLQGQNEELAHQLDDSLKQQKTLYNDLDTRLKALEQAKPAAAASTGAAPGNAPAADTSTTNDDAKAYQDALSLVKSGDYAGAVASLGNFLQQYPQSPYAPSAQYWIGNSQFAMKDYKAALASQKKLIAQWPDNAKVPDAMLNISTIEFEQGDKKAARAQMQELISKYPDSQAADLARRRLKQIK